MGRVCMARQLNPCMLEMCLILGRLELYLSWLENTCDSLVIFWSFLASFFIPHSVSKDNLKRERVWKQQSSGLLEKEFDSGSNHFDHIKFMKWWYEMGKSRFNIGRDLDFFLHVPGSRESLWVNWNHCESKHKLRYRSLAREDVSECNARRPGAMLEACRGRIIYTAAAGPQAVAGAASSHLPVPLSLAKLVLCPTTQPAYVQQQWGGNEGVLGACTEQNYMWELFYSSFY